VAVRGVSLILRSVSDITPHMQPLDDGDPPPYWESNWHSWGRTPTWRELSEQPDGLHVEYAAYGSFRYVRGGCGTEVRVVDGNILEARLDSTRRSRFIQHPPGYETMALLPNEVMQWLWTGGPPPRRKYYHAIGMMI
jgi:hypothetical protein